MQFLKRHSLNEYFCKLTIPHVLIKYCHDSRISLVSEDIGILLIEDNC